MKVALLATDNRDHDRSYSETVPRFGTAPEALLQGFAQLPELEVHVVSCAQQPLSSPEKLAPNIFFHSLRVPKIGWLRTGYQGCIRAVRRKLGEIKPDVVHGQGTERDCAISAALSGYPSVVTIHGNMAELARRFRARVGSYGWLSARLENFTLQRTAGVFCNSEYTESLVQPRARRTWRVPNAIRQQFFDPPTEPARSRKCILMSVGVISPRKRQLELLELAEQLQRQGLEFEFQFAGNTPPAEAYAADFLKKIKPLEESGCARYVGTKSTRELIECFDRSAALVHFPSEEAFGLVAAEGLARNLKFFGARLGGIREIANGIPDAELFDAEDWTGLGAGIARWIRGGFPRSSSADPIMRVRYHPEVIARRHFEIYREVLSKDS